MKKVFLACFVFCVFVFPFGEVKGSDLTDVVKKEIDKYKVTGNVLDNKVEMEVFNFKLAKACYEKMLIIKNDEIHPTDCKNTFAKNETKNLKGIYSAQKRKYEKRLEQWLVKRLTKDKYSPSDFKLVLDSIIYKDFKSKNDTSLSEVKPSFPSALLFPKDQKRSILSRLFSREKIIETEQDFDENSKDDNDVEDVEYTDIKDFSDKRLEKVKILLTAAKEVDYKNSIDINEEDEEGNESANQKTSSFKRVLGARVKNKGDLFCPQLIHFAVSKSQVGLVQYIVDQYKEVFGRRYSKEEVYRKLKSYLDNTTYDAKKLAEAQDEYNRQKNKEGAELTVCGYGTVTNNKSGFQKWLERNGVLDSKEINTKKAIMKQIQNPAKYSPLSIAYLFVASTKPKEALDISLILLQNGARYREDLGEARDKSIKLQKERDEYYRLRKQIPKYYSNVFEDFLMIGGNLDIYQMEKKEILKKLVEADRKESSTNDVKERYESLLDQAIYYNNKNWCDFIMDDLVLNEDDKTFRSGVYNYIDGYSFGRGTRDEKSSNQPDNDKQVRQIERAKRWAEFLSFINKKDAKKYRGNLNRKINAIKTTPLEASMGTNCEDSLNNKTEDFSVKLKDLNYSSYSSWKKGQEVYTVFHYQAQSSLFSKNSSETKDVILALNSKLQDAGVQQVGDRVKEISNFIINAKDAKGKTAWDYGIKLLFDDSSEELERYINYVIDPTPIETQNKESMNI